MLGGLSRELFFEINILSESKTLSGITSYKWECIPLPANYEKTYPQGFYGHISCVYRTNKIIIFGGTRLYNKSAKTRECLNDLYILDPETFVWDHIKSTGSMIEARRNHCGCTIGKHLIIHGGINEHGEFFDDLQITNLDLYFIEKTSPRWVTLNTKGEKLGKL